MSAAEPADDESAGLRLPGVFRTQAAMIGDRMVSTSLPASETGLDTVLVLSAALPVRILENCLSVRTLFWMVSAVFRRHKSTV